ncbi:MAG: MoxR family ATPase [Nitrospiraceae bacterium]|nr:MAG: MoxR family ATPase [Nitrospiraceae bacterium]
MDDLIKKLINSVSTVIKGKEDVIKYAVVTLLARGHLLIEDVPGVGKTTLAFTIAKAIDCIFQRIQCTSDLLPSDIIGVNIYNPETREFQFRQGPLFANVVLVDEINRTSPKTQSALLEAMSERRVSVERKTYHIPEPFMVIATQNPIEYHGTFPLPESQLDRFMMHFKIGYPEHEYERQALLDIRDFDDIEKAMHILTREDILRMQGEVNTVRVDQDLLDYVLNIVKETRNHDRIRLGVSTRGAQFLLKASRSLAYVNGRDYVLPDDVKELSPMVFGHRIILKSRTYISDADELIRDIVEHVNVPV